MSLTGLEVRLVLPGEVAGFNELLAAHHYLGSRGSGRRLRYAACLDGEPAVLATFGSAAWKCRAREEFLGWDDEQRAARLGALAGNQRLCVLPAGRRPNLASAALGAMLRRLPGDYLAMSGRPVVAVETFTDPARGAGAVYAGAGFTPAGLTAGYGRARGRSDYVFRQQRRDPKPSLRAAGKVGPTVRGPQGSARNRVIADEPARDRQAAGRYCCCSAARRLGGSAGRPGRMSPLTAAWP